MLKKFAITVAIMVTGLVGLEVGSRAFTHRGLSVVSSAEARVGRPLTPVSVAGVARRTTRRCAVGVYNC
jgi:hypothetical protein